MKAALKLWVLPLIVTIVCAIAGTVTSNSSFAQSTLEEVQTRGKLLAGVRFSNPPNGYIDVQGNHIGFAPDLAREFARHLGVDVEFVQVTSKNRIPLLLNGQIDADIGTTTPTKTRDEVVDFSHVYVVDQTVIIIREGESTDPEDYFNNDKIVGVQQGSNDVNLWRRHSPDAKFKEYQEMPEIMVALAQGKVDVVPSMTFQARELIERMGPRADNIAVGGTFFEDFMAIGLRENDSDWRDWVNWALQRMWTEGTFQELYRKHYKMEPAFNLGDSGRRQPGHEKVAKENDPW
jgi:polar amino acid transport system substrate-binding protein